MEFLQLPSVRALRAQLEQHPIYRAVDSLPRLRCFMEHHIFSVWDFMSLVKTMQGVVAPAKAPWMPGKDTTLRRFINDMVLGEESDEWPQDGKITYISHFELYQKAMLEVGADIKRSNDFLRVVDTLGVDAALSAKLAMPAARSFMRTTFDCLASNKPHVVMASLAVGREHIIPEMFRALLRDMAIEESAARRFIITCSGMCTWMASIMAPCRCVCWIACAPATPRALPKPKPRRNKPSPRASRSGMASWMRCKIPTASERELPNGMGNSHRPGNPRPAFHRIENF